MKIYNQEKTQILENPDLKKGYLMEDKIVVKTIPATEEVQEQFHYEYKDYPSGGRDRIKVVDVAYQPAKPETYEYEDIQVYVLFTEEELINNEISTLTEQLEKTDYIANKLAEAVSKYISTGDNTDVLLLREKYSLELSNRETWRNRIDKLQQDLKLLAKQN